MGSFLPFLDERIEAILLPRERDLQKRLSREWE
jgi:hypothetical protein